MNASLASSCASLRWYVPWSCRCHSPGFCAQKIFVVSCCDWDARSSFQSLHEGSRGINSIITSGKFSLHTRSFLRVYYVDRLLFRKKWSDSDLLSIFRLKYRGSILNDRITPLGILISQLGDEDRNFNMTNLELLSKFDSIFLA
jgi:hypothetical protein